MLLVIGATGYFGAGLVALLRARGLAPRAVVRPERARALPPGLPWAVAEPGDPVAPRPAENGCAEGMDRTASWLAGPA